MAWCEANRLYYLFGLARNARLIGEIEPEPTQAGEESHQTGKPARRFKDHIAPSPVGAARGAFASIACSQTRNSIVTTGALLSLLKP